MASSQYTRLHSPRIASPSGDDDLGRTEHYVDPAAQKSPLRVETRATAERSFSAYPDAPLSSSPPSPGGHTFSSPLLHPARQVQHRDTDIPDIDHHLQGPSNEGDSRRHYVADVILCWPLAEQVFGPLLQEPDFPVLFGKHMIRHNVSEALWTDICSYVDNNLEILKYFSFYYNPSQQSLTVMAPLALHELVTAAILKAAQDGRIDVDDNQTLIIDHSRAIKDAVSRHQPDGIVCVKYSVVVKPAEGNQPPRKILKTDDVIVVQIGDAERIDHMLDQTQKGMVEAGPVLFIAVKITEHKYIEPEDPQPDDDGFIPGAGAANDIICTGYKRNGRVLIGRLRATFFAFLASDLPRNLATPVLLDYNGKNLMPAEDQVANEANDIDDVKLILDDDRVFVWHGPGPMPSVAAAG
ncbi:uncharacterized protein B0H18DRAFT_1126498 [Fomitopsis serialis]|uniref:uncharacterized protein n=1 Tax=Fomitopsis serialis TaxID=139415 RepID=UPI002007F4E1|nr:uncharacterized protein B0H18DRAFT_1126498 [Neoantrodia serialis]KAH9913219.1 hypothetical protein B0H18DRAFT_1126498 [Neoantrodia serialis]